MYVAGRAAGRRHVALACCRSSYKAPLARAAVLQHQQRQCALGGAHRFSSSTQGPTIPLKSAAPAAVGGTTTAASNTTATTATGANAATGGAAGAGAGGGGSSSGGGSGGGGGSLLTFLVLSAGVYHVYDKEFDGGEGLQGLPDRVKLAVTGTPAEKAEARKMRVIAQTLKDREREEAGGLTSFLRSGLDMVKKPLGLLPKKGEDASAVGGGRSGGGGGDVVVVPPPLPSTSDSKDKGKDSKKAAAVVKEQQKAADKAAKKEEKDSKKQQQHKRKEKEDKEPQGVAQKGPNDLTDTVEVDVIEVTLAPEDDSSAAAKNVSAGGASKAEEDAEDAVALVVVTEESADSGAAAAGGGAAAGKDGKGKGKGKGRAAVPDAQVDAMHKAQLTYLTEAQLAETAALRKELELTLLNDLDELDEKALRYRIVQLAAEMTERTKWEGLRTLETLRQAQEEAARKSTALIAEAKEAGERAKVTALEEQQELIKKKFTAVFNKQLEENLRAQAQDFEEMIHAKLSQQESEIKAHYEAEANQQVKAIHTMAINDANDRRTKLNNIRTKLNAIMSAMESRSDVERASAQVHRLTHACLLLEEALMAATAVPIGKEVAAFKEAAAATATGTGGSPGPVVTAVVTSLPPSAINKGIPSTPQLLSRFHVVHKECYKASLVPEDSPGLLGQLVGSAKAAVSFAPTGMVEGNTAEDILARASTLVEQGLLREAVKEMEGLKKGSLPAQVAQDWLIDAKNRLTADQAMSVLKAHVALVNAAHA